MRRRFACALIVVLALGLTGCGEAPPGVVHLLVAPEQQALFDAFAAPLSGRVLVETSGDPAAAVADAPSVAVAVVTDLSGAGTYRLEEVDGGYVVHGDAPLGVQYGLAHLLEAMGFGFYHPHESHAPHDLARPDPSLFGVVHTPERALRGLHLHTLHPIEAHFDFWEPSDEGLARARATIDWIVKNRGNYVQWPGLDDVQTDPAVRDAWVAHTQAILDDAHARGVQVGFGLQLFGLSNLQRAYDLVDDPDGDLGAQIDAGLAPLEGLDFDAIQVSFGEFSGADPAAFVSTLDLAVAKIRAAFPSADVSAVVHLGNYPSLEVDYMGETQLYYYLVRYAADPDLVPWIHTVMYYDLFEDAGGAYGYDEFSGHRDYLFERLAAGAPVAYFPETAYWIAFDDSIPTYLPLYVRSRFVDLREIRAHAEAEGHADLDAHVVFSSGWEWGYWQHDWAALRMSYELPERYDDLFAAMFAPYGARGARLAEEIAALAETEHDALLVGRLAAWLASRDFTFDFGQATGIVSQPSRPSYAEIAKYDAAARAQFRADVVDPLAAFADALVAHRDALTKIVGDAHDPFLAEVVDGAAVTAERAAFAHALLESVLAHAEGDDASASAHIDEARAIEARARTIVERRHRALHYPVPDDITASTRANASLYQYGYLREANTLCYFDRERLQVERMVIDSRETIPRCVL